jgi:hypothetical protein
LRDHRTGHGLITGRQEANSRPKSKSARRCFAICGIADRSVEADHAVKRANYSDRLPIQALSGVLLGCLLAKPKWLGQGRCDRQT